MKSKGHSKKFMPADLKRITNAEGKRVWITGGREFVSLADLRHAIRIALAAAEARATDKNEKE
jgi:hypothetical protein